MVWGVTRLARNESRLEQTGVEKQLLAQLHFANVNGLWRLDGLVHAAERICMGSSHACQGGSGNNGFDLHLTRLRVFKNFSALRVKPETLEALAEVKD
jgi:hypothetical protein